MSPESDEQPRLRLALIARRRSRELRRAPTLAEQRLWKHLRDRALGLRFRRQHVLLGRFVADFYCAKARLCIEVDGGGHADEEQGVYDRARTRLLESRGYRVIQFTNAEVFENLGSVLTAIQEACGIAHP